MARHMACSTCGSEGVTGVCASCATVAKARTRSRRVLLAFVLVPVAMCLVSAGAVHLVLDQQGTVSVDASAPYARLRLLALTCDNANDGLLDFFEEPSIDVADRTVWEGADFRTGTIADLSSIDCVIKGKAALRMFEEDQVADDPLGAKHVDAAPIEDQYGFLDHEQTTRFTLAWRVEPLGPEQPCAVLRLRTLRRSGTAAPGFSYVETVRLLVNGKPMRESITPRLWPTPLGLAVPFEETCTLQLQIDVTRTGDSVSLISHLSNVETLAARDRDGARSLVFRIGAPHEAEYVVRCDVVQ